MILYSTSGQKFCRQCAIYIYCSSFPLDSPEGSRPAGNLPPPRPRVEGFPQWWGLRDGSSSSAREKLPKFPWGGGTSRSSSSESADPDGLSHADYWADRQTTSKAGERRSPAADAHSAQLRKQTEGRTREREKKNLAGFPRQQTSIGRIDVCLINNLREYWLAWSSHQWVPRQANFKYYRIYRIIIGCIHLTWICMSFIAQIAPLAQREREIYRKRNNWR